MNIFNKFIRFLKLWWMINSALFISLLRRNEIKLLVITSINPNTKKPTAVYQGNHYPDGKKKYEWGNKWTDEQLLSADYLGVYHREDKDKNKPVCAAVDFDDKKYVAHDEQNDCNEGDTVRIMETRPLSKSKCWRLVEIIERAK